MVLSTLERHYAMQEMERTKRLPITISVLRQYIHAIIIVVHPVLFTYVFPYGSASAQLAETLWPDTLNKTYVKSGDDLKIFRSLYPRHSSSS